MHKTAYGTLLAALLAAGSAAAAPVERHAYFGELHLHTTFSLDAYILFGTGVTPDQALRFAKGEPITALGVTHRRAEPLDFMAVTDHAEQYGFGYDMLDPNSALSQSAFGQQVRAGAVKSISQQAPVLNGPAPPQPAAQRTQQAAKQGVDARTIAANAWTMNVEAANRNNEPGKFTALIGYEWSSFPNQANLHRNVIFRGATAPVPFSATDSDRPEDLWTYLEENRARGIQAIAIPHNGNVSNGLMYDWNDSDRRPIDAKYAMRRALNEPLSEISQQKGQSDTHPLLSPQDEFANFEVFDWVLGSEPKFRATVQGGYVRQALGRGLTIGAKIGVNPYKFGAAGGSDFHTGLSISARDAYVGVNSETPESMSVALARQAIGQAPPPRPTMESIITQGGSLTGVWAEANTREGIWDALARKEAFATSGPRIQVRVFGGWGFGRDVMRRADWAAQGYAGGVPMGGDLPARPTGGKAPRFLLWALKDPNGANLDRIQVIKLSLKGEGYQERIFDAVLAGKRKQGTPVGSSVDLVRATYSNGIGAAELAGVWEDPEFDPVVPAVYYLRVLEIPTPRWSSILAVRKGLELPSGAPATVQDRAWSSPIWYTPR